MRCIFVIDVKRKKKKKRGSRKKGDPISEHIYVYISETMGNA